MKADPMDVVGIWLPIAGALVGITGTILAARGKGDTSVAVTLSWSLLTGIGASAAAYASYKRDQAAKLREDEQRARLEQLENQFGMFAADGSIYPRA